MDLASLAIKIDASSVDPAAAGLDKVVGAADRAEKAVNDLGSASVASSKQMRSVSQAADDMARQALRSAASVDKAGGASQLAGYHVQNLAFQFNDLFVGLASGQKPMTVFMQQGTQIAQIMGQAGVGVGGLTKEVGGMIGRFAAAHPYLAAFGAVAAAAAASVGVFTASMNSDRKGDIDAFTASLGLSKQELEKLGPVAITAGDVIKGLGQTIEEYLGINASQIIGEFKKLMLSAFKAVGEYSMVATAAIYAGFVGTFNGVKSVWSSLPAALGDVAYSAANAVIAGLNWLLRKGAEYTNKFLAMVNGVMANIPGFDGKAIDAIKGVQIEALSNPYAGTAAKVGRDFAGEVTKAFGTAMAGQRGFIARVGENTFGAFKDRINAKADDIIDGRKAGAAGAKAGKAAGDAMLKAMMDALDRNLVTAFENILAKNADALAKAAAGATGFEAALKAANDNTDAMQKPILDAAKATAEWNESLRRTINYLDQLGGFGSKLGNLGALFEGLRTGDFTSVGGKLGAFAGLFTQTDGGKALVSELRDVLDHTFGGNGQFTKKIDDALKGAGLGLASAQMVFGSGGTNVGSGIGGALGQGLGKALGPAISKAVGGTLGKALGSAAGPLGAIAGGILGNLIGGLFSKTKKASATIGLSGDGLGISGLTGNNSTLRSGASSAANSVIEALMNIADQFGAGIGGSISTSIGIRKKSYRVDTTGQGRVQGAGVLDFGEDAQAALKAAIQDAISDGVFTGLSDGVNRLLKGDGDLEAQLKKALSYQGVFDELKQRKDPTGYAMEQVDKWRAGMDKIFAEAGATSDDLAKLEELTGLKRTEILAQANEKALELANDRKQLEIQIMELEGKSTEALAAARELEKAGVDATLRPLYDRIYALQDEAAATAEAAAKAKEIADERLGLEGQLLQVLGDTAEIRARELAALDPSNRAIQQRIWQIEAQQAADEALNAHTKAVLDEQYGLVTQLLNLQGDTNKLRARELAALDPVNRSILEQIFALTDLKAAQDDAAKAAQEAAQVQKAIADERYGLETQLLNLLGDTATIRARELALLDPSNRALQQRIWAITDAQAAEEARVKAMQEAGRAEIKAREDQIASINDTISALSGATERWSGLAKEIREFRAGLFSGTVGSGTSYKQSEAEFRRVSKMAAFGDEGALQSFTGVSKAFLDAARDNARSLVDYQRAIGLVAGAADAAAAGADGVARQAADQIAVLMAQRVELETLNAQTQASLETLNASADVQANDVVPTLEQMVKEQQAASDDASKARAEQKVENLAMVTALNQIARILDRVSQGGESFTVATDGNSLSVTVESSAAAPVHVVTP